MSLVGFRFRPAVKELIGVLEIMAHGGDTVDVSQLTETPGDISAKELYGEVDKEPWKLLRNDNEWELYDVANAGKKATYVVTRLPKMGEYNKVVRKAGNGTWLGQTQPMAFEKDGEEIAYMKSLSYLYTGPSSEAEDNCYYYLHEYYLSKPYLENIGAKFTDYVICRIIKDTSKRCRCGRNANNKRRRDNDFASSSSTKKGNESYNPKTLASDLPGNPSSFGLCANDHNLGIQDWQHNNMVLQEPPLFNPCNSEFTENLNPAGLWVNGYNPETHPCYGSTVMEQQQHHQDSTSSGLWVDGFTPGTRTSYNGSTITEPQHHQDSASSGLWVDGFTPETRSYYGSTIVEPQHHQDSDGKSVAQEPPSLYEGGTPLQDQEPPLYQDDGSASFSTNMQQQQQYSVVQEQASVHDEGGIWIDQDFGFPSFYHEEESYMNPNVAHQEPLVGASNQERQEDHAIPIDALLSEAELIRMLQILS